MGVVISFFKRLFTPTPDPYNPTNGEIQHHLQTESPQKEQEGTEESLESQSEAGESEVDAQKCQEVKLATELASPDIELAEPRGEGSEMLEKKAMETEVEVKPITEESKQVMLDVEEETNTGALTQEQEAEAWITADAHPEPETFHWEGLEGNIQPEVWPTEEEFQLAKTRIEYDPEKLNFAVCGSSGSGKSSLVNAFRGLKNNSPHAASAGIVENTMDITRYPDPQQKMPYNRLVWFDCPGAGTLKVPGCQYFNQQGLFIFDVIVLVYDTRFTEIDLSIIRNCEGFKIPLFIVRSKADTHIQNSMKDLGYDEDDDDAEINYEKYQEQARQLLIDKTKRNVKENLEEAGLAMHDIFIVSDSAIYSLVTMKPKKKKTTPPMIDEARLVKSILKAAYERRYSTQAAASTAQSWATISRGKNTTTALRFKQVITHHLSEMERFKKNMTTLIGDQSKEEEQSTSPVTIWPRTTNRVKNVIS